MARESANAGNQPAPMPRIAQSMTLLLQSMGVTEIEPRVVHQLLEMTFRTALDYMESAVTYAEHAGRQEMTVEDVKLAVQSKISAEFTGPPPRELLAEIAAERNKEPLPIIPEKFGVRLPPEKYCLTQPNYRVLIPPSTASVPAPMDLTVEPPVNTLPNTSAFSNHNQSSLQVPKTASAVVAMEDDNYDDE